MRIPSLCVFVPLCLGVLFTTPVFADVDLAYQPMRVDLRLTPGQIQTGAIQLKNQAPQAIHVRARMLDFYVSGDNTPQFAAQNDDAYSCKNWTMLNPTELDIAAGAVVPFRYTMQVPAAPAAASRTFRCAIAFESMPTLEDRLQKRASNQVRLVTVLYATIGEPVAVPEIGNPEVEKTEQGWRVQMPFANSGETHYRLNGQILIKDAANRTIETIDMDSSPIHPHTNVRIGYPIQALPPGEYTMSLQLKFGAKILVKEAIVEVQAAE